MTEDEVADWTSFVKSSIAAEASAWELRKQAIDNELNYRQSSVIAKYEEIEAMLVATAKADSSKFRLNHLGDVSYHILELRWLGPTTYPRLLRLCVDMACGMISWRFFRGDQPVNEGVALSPDDFSLDFIKDWIVKVSQYSLWNPDLVVKLKSGQEVHIEDAVTYQSMGRWLNCRDLASKDVTRFLAEDVAQVVEVFDRFEVSSDSLVRTTTGSLYKMTH
jgi:hypothetical protein